jgi:hypothetical protein
MSILFSSQPISGRVPPLSNFAHVGAEAANGPLGWGTRAAALRRLLCEDCEERRLVALSPKGRAEGASSGQVSRRAGYPPVHSK